MHCNSVFWLVYYYHYWLNCHYGNKFTKFVDFFFNFIVASCIFYLLVCFQVVLHGVVNMQLPNQWLWDMVDEFVYQFQSFCQYRAKMKNKTEQEIALLRQYDQVFFFFFF